MAKLHFYYATMNAGKTTLLLQNNYNNEEKKINTLLLIPNITSKNGIIYSRIGISRKAILINEHLNLFLFLTKLIKKPKIILIDEVQFLTKKQIFELISIVDILKINIFTYGLRTDFKGNLFNGSKYLLAFADKIIEIKSICKCGDKAIMNLRIKNGQKAIHGNLIDLNKDHYVSVCRYHFYNFLKLI